MDDKNPYPVVTAPMIFRGKPVAMILSYAHKGDCCWHASINNFHQGRIKATQGGGWQDVDKKFTNDEVKWLGHRIDLRLAEINRESIFITDDRAPQ